MNIDGVLLLEATNINAGRRPGLGGDSSPMDPAFLSSFSRPMGPMVINDAVKALGLPSTVVNYVDFWQTEDLLEFIDTWLTQNNVTNGCFALSSLFQVELALTSGTTIYEIVQEIKTRYPTFKIVCGGPALNFAMNPNQNWEPDAVFSSNNSVGLFQDWLLNKDIPEDCIKIHPNGVPEYRAPAGFSSRDVTLVEKPHVPILHDDYCLDSQDTLTFEIRKGCKFNCGFCSYEFRNAKNVQDVDVDELTTFFSDAYHKFGIKTFMVADDTPNEENVKLEILWSAVKDLPEQMSIGGFNRFDVLAKRPEQIELLDKIGFHSHLFGIESLGEDKARKTIGKGGSKQDMYDALENIRDNYPHWFTYSSFMAGLPYDSPDEWFAGINKVVNNNLIKGILLNPLYMFDIDEWQGNMTMLNSNFQFQPEKFGFVPDEEHNFINPGWSRYEIDSSKIIRRLRAKAIKSDITHVLPFQLVMLKGLGWDGYSNSFAKLKDSVTNPEPHESEIELLRDKKISNYITAKKLTVNT